MPINPQFLAARAKEQSARLLTYLPWPRPIVVTLRSRGGWLSWWPRNPVTSPVVHFTERHHVELTFAQNAFVIGARPLRGDVFQFLWRLHPEFMRPDGTLANQGHRRATWCERRRARRVQKALHRAARLCDLDHTAIALRAYLSAVELDANAYIADEKPRKRRGLAVAPHNYFDDYTEYMARTYGLTPEAAMDMPRALSFQWQRQRALLAEPEFVSDPSDELLASSPSSP